MTVDKRSLYCIAIESIWGKCQGYSKLYLTPDYLQKKWEYNIVFRAENNLEWEKSMWHICVVIINYDNRWLSWNNISLFPFVLIYIPDISFSYDISKYV